MCISSWRVRGCRGENLRIEGEGRLTTVYSQQEPNAQEALVPLAFNWEAQYMAETLAPIEEKIVKINEAIKGFQENIIEL